MFAVVLFYNQVDTIAVALIHIIIVGIYFKGIS